MQVIKLKILVTIIILTASCGQRKSLNASAFLQWVDNPSNGLVQERIIDEFKFVAQYRPFEYLIALDKIDGQRIESSDSDYSDLQYCVIKIATTTGKREFLSQSVQSDAQYYERIQYYTSQAQNDIYLIDDTDTLRCQLYHFERTYGASGDGSIMYAKESNNITKEVIGFINKKYAGN